MKLISRSLCRSLISARFGAVFPDWTVIQKIRDSSSTTHLRTIRDRILGSTQSIRLLEIYRQVLHQKEVVAVDRPEQKELLLSRLLVNQQGFLKVNNRIYAFIFNHSWVNKELGSIAKIFK
jgi:hypothetical protein